MADYGGYGGGAFGGGGFVASPGDGAKDAGDRGGKQTRNDAVIPVTVKALTEAVQANALDDQVKLFGAEVGNLTLVGKLVNVVDSATQMMYTLDDGTGKIDLKLWIDADAAGDNQLTKLELKRGVYVRVVGTLRSFQGTKQVLAYSVRPVTDHDEVTFHFLEVCYVKAQLMKQHSGAGGGAGAGGGGGSAWNAAPPAHPYAAAGGGGGAPAHVSGNVRDDVRAVYESPMGRGSEGISIDAVVNALGGKYTMQAVQEAVEHLVNMEGVLYSTIDERHFKSVNT